MRYAEILAVSSVLAGSALAAPAPQPWCVFPFCGDDSTPSTTSSSKAVTSSAASSGWGSSSSMKTTSSCSTSSTSAKVSSTSSSAAPSTSSSSAVVSTSRSAAASTSSSSSSIVSTSSAAPVTSSVVATTASAAATTSSSTSTAPTVSPTIVASDDGYNYQFCAIEPFENGVPNGRAFSGDSFRNANMTVDLCVDYCSNLGYTYFGVEYADECYCGNSFNQGTTLDTANTCNMACAGDATELCGGAGAMNVYEIADAATTVLPTTYSYSSTATATVTGVAGGAGSGSGSGSATTTATAAATTVPAAGGFSSVTCAIEPFQNGAGDRALNDDHISTPNMTVEFCADYCSEYAYFGVEWSSECYCGNTVASGTTQDSTQSNCNMACSGDATELCGGSGRFNLYENPANGGSQISLPSTVSATSTSTSAVVASSTSSVVVATTTSSVAATSSSVATSSAIKTSSTSASAAVSTSSAVQPTSSAVKTSSSVVPTTLATSTKTSSAVASATPGVCAPRGSTDLSLCPAVTVNSIFGATKFSNYYKGSGYTINKSNPANLLSWMFPPKVFTFDASHSICSAASQCMNQAGLMTTLYHSFDLHWDTNSCQWNCQLFQGQNSIPSYFNVPAPSVSHGCGFSGGLI